MKAKFHTPQGEKFVRLEPGDRFTVSHHAMPTLRVDTEDELAKLLEDCDEEITLVEKDGAEILLAQKPGTPRWRGSRYIDGRWDKENLSYPSLAAAIKESVRRENQTPQEKITALQARCAEALRKLCPDFGNLPSARQNQLSDSLLGDLVATQGIPSSGAISVLETKPSEEIQALADLLDFDNIPEDIKTFYQKRAGKTPESPELQ